MKATLTPSSLISKLLGKCWGEGKPVSLSYRCPCRFFESHVARANVKHLKILNTPNCALQIVARLKNNNRQVCIDTKLKWVQEHLEKFLNNLINATPAGRRVLTRAPALHPSPPFAVPSAGALCEIRLWPPPEWSRLSPGECEISSHFPQKTRVCRIRCNFKSESLL
ncbi:PREDICTED: stromal cell-derived factor 1 [Galeopterus variegatus]|uniref:Stromal cell-derived factor 1 n=1 Tax=Galeopterus variegatus TaxID=482537 RepID=A0ABM0SD19_GALVR|nr:PREDICTED: stromal cell-derived factor 1 [Galeopterus variegatus]